MAAVELSTINLNLLCVGLCDKVLALCPTTSIIKAAPVLEIEEVVGKRVLEIKA